MAWLGLAGTNQPSLPLCPPGNPEGSDKASFPDQVQIDS